MPTGRADSKTQKLGASRSPAAVRVYRGELAVRRAKRSTKRDGFLNTLEFALTTKGRRFWSAVQSVGWLRRLCVLSLIRYADGAR